MADKVTVNFDGVKPSDIAEALGASTQARDAVTEIADKIADTARQLAKAEVTGHGAGGTEYNQSFGSGWVHPAAIRRWLASKEARSWIRSWGGTEATIREQGVIGVAYNTDTDAHWVEWGTFQEQPRHIMLRAAEAHGPIDPGSGDHTPKRNPKRRGKDKKSPREKGNTQ